MTTTRRAFGALAAGAALAALAPAAPVSAAPRHRHLIAHDDFRHGLGRWAVELERGGTVTARRGILEVDVPAGATIWFTQPLAGPYVLKYTATPVSAGGVNDRVSDLNNFWNAVDVRSPEHLFAVPRGGALAEYDYLKTYYAGYGANYNTTTRLRRYVGESGVRPLIYDYTGPSPTRADTSRSGPPGATSGSATSGCGSRSVNAPDGRAIPGLANTLGVAYLTDRQVLPTVA